MPYFDFMIYLFILKNNTIKIVMIFSLILKCFVRSTGLKTPVSNFIGTKSDILVFFFLQIKGFRFSSC